MDEKILKPNNFDDTTMASDLITLNSIDSKINMPLKFKLKLKRALGSMESHTLYRINNENSLMTKVDSNIQSNELRFESQQTGTYVVKYEKNYTVLIGVLVGVAVLLVLVGAIAVFFYFNPKYIKSLRYQASNAKRSMNNTL